MNQPFAFVTVLLLTLSDFASAEFDSESDLVLKTFLRPNRSIEIAATQNGIISEILVERGEAVKEGAPLIKLESAVLEAQLEQAISRSSQNGRISSAQAEVSMAEKRLGIIEGLAERGTSNASELEKARLTLQIAEGNLAAAREDLEIQRFEISRIKAELDLRVLKSPISGVITQISRDVAESVSIASEGDDAWLVQVVDLSQLKATAHVPFRASINLKRNLEIELLYNPHDESGVMGSIHYLSATVDAATGTREIEVIFDNSEGDLTSGVPGFLKIPSGTQ